MSIAILLAILIITCVMCILQYKRIAIFGFLLIFIYLAAIGYGIVPTILLKQLELSYPPLLNPQWGQRNLIILLGGGAVKIPGTSIVQPPILSYSRIYEAAKLYTLCKNSGHQCTILVSGADVTETSESEAANYSKALTDIGVNKADIRLELRSRNTFQNAKFCKDIINTLNINKIFLVTNGYHIKRSLLFFSYFNIHAIPAPSDYLSAYFSSVPLAYNFAITDISLHELLGILQFHIYNRMGWNK